MTRSIVLAIAICTGSALLEGLLSGRGVWQRFSQLILPRPSPSLMMWSVIGIAYYLVFGAVLYRLLLLQPTGLRITALSLTLIVLLANAFWNDLFFRVQSLGQSLIVSVVYSLVALGLLSLLIQLDRVAAWCLLPYVGYTHPSHLSLRR